MYIQWVMSVTTQFSMRMESDLIRKIDEEAEKEYKTRTELIKEAVQLLLSEKQEKKNIKRLAAELWLKGELSEAQLKKALSEEEVKDLQFGKHLIEEIVDEIRR